MIDFVVDENVQIHGGNGFVRDYPGRAAVPRRARQPDLRRHQRDQPPADPGHARQARDQGHAADHRGRAHAAGRAALADRRRRPATARSTRRGAPSRGMKKTALMVLGTAMQTYGDRLSDEQEVLMRCADIIIDVYAVGERAAARRAAGGAAAPRGRAGVRQRCRRPRRARRARRAGGHGGRGHAAGAHRGAPAADEGRRPSIPSPCGAPSQAALAERRGYPF